MDDLVTALKALAALKLTNEQCNEIITEMVGVRREMKGIIKNRELDFLDLWVAISDFEMLLLTMTCIAKRVDPEWDGRSFYCEDPYGFMTVEDDTEPATEDDNHGQSPDAPPAADPKPELN